LSRSDMVEKASETAPAKAPNAEEDDLDIPAFLRRQAN
jgi:cell division protein FtsZ